MTHHLNAQAELDAPQPKACMLLFVRLSAFVCVCARVCGVC